MYVIDTETGMPATWGKMFLRGFVIDGVLNSITSGIFFLLSAIWIFTNPQRQRLTDLMLKTIVVDAPNGLRSIDTQSAARLTGCQQMQGKALHFGQPPANRWTASARSMPC